MPRDAEPRPPQRINPGDPLCVRCHQILLAAILLASCTSAQVAIEPEASRVRTGTTPVSCPGSTYWNGVGCTSQINVRSTSSLGYQYAKALIESFGYVAQAHARTDKAISAFEATLQKRPPNSKVVAKPGKGLKDFRAIRTWNYWRAWQDSNLRPSA
jgi:hypothetical protein